jgi:hypothetical protein
LNSLRISREFALFCELVKSGLLYERLADECRKADVAIPEGAGSARDWCKRRLLVDFLAKRTFATPGDQRQDKRRMNYDSEIGRVVFSLFPLLYDAVKTVNQEDEATLIRLLQAGEAWFIFNQVCNRLVHADVPVVTVHDAIFTAEANVPTVVDAFSEAGREIGFTFQTKRE